MFHGEVLAQRFGRLFPGLRPWQGDSQVVTDLAKRLYARPQRDNPRIAAGFTYFGQFITHDLSFDPRPVIRGVAKVDARTARFDLDSLFAGGPTQAPQIYDRAGSGRLLTETRAGGCIDLPRNSQSIALIGDPRNDENLITAQIHLGFIHAFNAQLAQLFAAGHDDQDAFTLAVTRLCWAYQWAVLRDWLPAVAGQAAIDDVLPPGEGGAAVYRPRLFSPTAAPFIPLEFAAGAMRFGHAMVRGQYSLNRTTDLPLFAPRGPTLAGSQPFTPELKIDWAYFFDRPPVGQTALTAAQRACRIEPAVAPCLSHLPGLDPASLARRTLLRGLADKLPSGQDIARAMGFDPVEPKESDPLWYYVLREAQAQHDGLHLGETGAAIVVGTIVDILAKDPDSILNREDARAPLLMETRAGHLTRGLFDMPQLARREPEWRQLGKALRSDPTLTRIDIGRTPAEAVDQV